MTGSVQLFNPEKLHIRWLDEQARNASSVTRRYTLTHSDSTGDLFLTIGMDYDRRQISGWYTRLMRDEVLGELLFEDDVPTLHIHMHVSGGLVLGPASWRFEIFKQHMAMVLQVICWGDRECLGRDPAMLDAPITAHFYSKKKAYNKTESPGKVRDFLIDRDLPG
jgi:hypothetical protein